MSRGARAPLLDGPVAAVSGTVAWDGADNGGDRAASACTSWRRSEGQVDVLGDVLK